MSHLSHLSHVAPITGHALEVQAARTAVVFVLVGAGLRLLGKREASQLNVYDLAMLMALANAVQNAMTGGLGNLGVGLVTSSVVVLLAWGATRLIVREPGLERLVIGSPTILVHRGRVLTDRLRRQRLSHDELRAAIRAYGLSDLRHVQTCVLEVDGSISVIPYPDKDPDKDPDKGPDRDPDKGPDRRSQPPGESGSR
jgi:uncharacterized membrane protein YcaP (DUF421 family)